MYWFEPIKPEHFKATVEISGCYCVCHGKYLYLKRHTHKPYGETWGVAAGKLEPGETPKECVIREVREEIGVNVNTPLLRELQILYCRIPELDFTYNMFYYPFDEFPKIVLSNNEHTDYVWASYEECLKLPLIVGGRESLIRTHKMLIESEGKQLF